MVSTRLFKIDERPDEVPSSDDYDPDFKDSQRRSVLIKILYQMKLRHEQSDQSKSF